MLLTLMTILVLIVLFVLVKTFVVVPMRENVVVERLGKFRAVLQPAFTSSYPSSTESPTATRCGSKS